MLGWKQVTMRKSLLRLSRTTPRKQAGFFFGVVASLPSDVRLAIPPLGVFAEDAPCVTNEVFEELSIPFCELRVFINVCLILRFSSDARVIVG